MKCFNCGVDVGEAFYTVKNGMSYCAACHIKKIGPLPGMEPPKASFVHVNAWAIIGIIITLTIPVFGYMLYGRHVKAKAAETARQEKLAKEEIERELQRQRETEERYVLLEEKKAKERKEAERFAAERAKAEAERQRLAREEAVYKMKAEAETREAAELARRQEAEAKMAAERAAEAATAARAAEQQQAAAGATAKEDLERAKRTFKTNYYAVAQLETKLADENTVMNANLAKLKKLGYTYYERRRVPVAGEEITRNDDERAYLSDSEVGRLFAAVRRSKTDIAAWENDLEKAKILLNEAKAVLDHNGSRPDEREPAKLPVYVLKNGTKIKAAMAVDGGDSYTIKDDAGKMHTIKKEDVAEILKP